jgi:hypothetical protein
LTPDEAVTQLTEAFIRNMTVTERDPWEFFDWSYNTWGFQQVRALRASLRNILAQESPTPQHVEQAVRVTCAVFATTGVPFNENAHGLGEASAEVFRSALRAIV